MSSPSDSTEFIGAVKISLSIYLSIYLSTEVKDASPADKEEAIQRRALTIINSYTNDMPYINTLYCAAIPSLADRREQLSHKLSTLILPL